VICTISGLELRSEGRGGSRRAAEQAAAAAAFEQIEARPRNA